MRRRTRGSTLSLVVLVFLLIVFNGVAAYFLIMLFGGGREVANLTDAGTLNVAKQAVTVPASTANYPDFQDMVYPYTPGSPNNAPGITLLTYNRCVAKALIIAYNAKMMTPQSALAITNAQHIIKELNDLGLELKQQLSSPSQLYTNFNSTTISAANNTRMWGNNPVTPTSGSLSYMKPDGPTNVYFNNAAVPGLLTQPSSDFNVPKTQTKMTPKDVEGVPAADVSSYLPGYVDLTVNGVTGTGGADTHIYGVPVFPQTNPHLVALTDFLTQQQPLSNMVPPNAFRINTKCKANGPSTFGGSVACAIVGDVSATAGGVTGANATIGNGMEFAASLPSGYIEFDNAPAVQPPLNYKESLFDNNLFNNELGALGCPNSTGTLDAGGNNQYPLGQSWLSFLGGSAPQYSTTICFTQDPGGVRAWIKWARGEMGPPAGGHGIYIGPINTNLNTIQGEPFSTATIPANYKSELASLHFFGDYDQAGQVSDQINCDAYLNQGPGLMDYCVAAIGAMLKTYNRDLPSPTGANLPDVSHDFSVADWAKAQLLVDFMTPNPSSAPGAPNGIGLNGPPTVTINDGLTSGLGVYPFIQTSPKPQVPNPPPDIPTPVSPFAGSMNMPTQRIGSIYDLLRMVQNSSCMQTTINQITQSCQQIQPTTTSQYVLQLLQTTQLPMSAAPPAGSSATTNGQWQKVFIYLPNADLSKPLTANSIQPIGYAQAGPDGTTSTAPPCYSNTYSLDNSIVDAHHDLGLHIQPYTIQQGGLTVTDQIMWTPGSGANNCLGRFQFQEIGSGTSTFVHIN